MYRNVLCFAITLWLACGDNFANVDAGAIVGPLPIDPLESIGESCLAIGDSLCSKRLLCGSNITYFRCLLDHFAGCCQGDGCDEPFALTPEEWEMCREDVARLQCGGVVEPESCAQTRPM